MFLVNKEHKEKEMDHFYINQICTKCWRGNQMFRVDLSLYDANGNLRQGVNEMDQYYFLCRFCWEMTRLDFYSFSHPSIILHLRHIERLHEQQTNAFKKLKDTFDKINSKK